MVKKLKQHEKVNSGKRATSPLVLPENSTPSLKAFTVGSRLRLLSENSVRAQHVSIHLCLHLHNFFFVMQMVAGLTLRLELSFFPCANTTWRVCTDTL